MQGACNLYVWVHGEALNRAFTSPEIAKLPFRRGSTAGTGMAAAVATAQGFPGGAEGASHTSEFDIPLRPGSYEAAEAVERTAHERELHTVNVGAHCI